MLLRLPPPAAPAACSVGPIPGGREVLPSSAPKPSTGPVPLPPAPLQERPEELPRPAPPKPSTSEVAPEPYKELFFFFALRPPSP